MFGTIAERPDPGRRPHRLPADARREPAGVERQLMTAPDMRGRLRAIRERGGKVVVIDPRRTRTAEVADEHHFIRPGHRRAPAVRDGARALRRGPRSTPAALAEHVERARRASSELARAVHARGRRGADCGIAADDIRRMARELAAAERAAVYGADRHLHAGVRHARRAGWSTCSTCSPATSTAPGGAMFTARRGRRRERDRRARPRAAASGSAAGTAACAGCPRRSASCRSRASPRRSRRRARARSARWSRIAGNPALSTPNAGRLRRARSTALDFMVSVDIYLNETTRHADVILPAPLAAREARTTTSRFYQLAVRNVANYSPPVFADRRSPARVEDAAAAGRRARRPGRGRRRRRARRLRRADADPGRGRRPALAARGRDPAEVLADARRPRAGPSACST